LPLAQWLGIMGWKIKNSNMETAAFIFSGVSFLIMLYGSYRLYKHWKEVEKDDSL
jgi:hypothetical protein